MLRRHQRERRRRVEAQNWPHVAPNIAPITGVRRVWLLPKQRRDGVLAEVTCRLRHVRFARSCHPVRRWRFFRHRNQEWLCTKRLGPVVVVLLLVALASGGAVGRQRSLSRTRPARGARRLAVGALVRLVGAQLGVLPLDAVRARLPRITLYLPLPTWPAGGTWIWLAGSTLQFSNTW